MNKNEVWEIFVCVLAARKKMLSDRQMDFLLRSRVRTEFFEAVMQIRDNHANA